MSQPAVHIIGGGASGLVCALELEKAGFSTVILEKDAHIGGRLRTTLMEGYPLDYGFQVLLTAYPAARKYLDFEKLDLRAFKPGSVVFKNGRKDKFGNFLRDASLLFPTLASRTGTFADKLRTYRLTRQVALAGIQEIFVKPSTTSLNYLRQRGFSEEMINDFFRPFFGGIFLEKELQTSSRMFEFIFKMFGAGSAAVPTQGIQEIAGQLAGRLQNTEFRLSTEVSGIADGVIILKDGSEIRSEVTIVAAPGFTPFEKENKIDWHGCTTHYFRAENNVLNAPIIGLVSDEGCAVNSFHYLDDLFGKQAGHHVLSATVVSDAANVSHERVADELTTYCGIQGLEHIRSFHIPRSLPMVDDVRYAARPEDVRISPGLYRTGDALANGSLNAAMESGRVVAEVVVEDL